MSSLILEGESGWSASSTYADISFDEARRPCDVRLRPGARQYQAHPLVFRGHLVMYKTDRLRNRPPWPRPWFKRNPKLA